MANDRICEAPGYDQNRKHHSLVYPTHGRQGEVEKSGEVCGERTKFGLNGENVASSKLPLTSM